MHALSVLDEFTGTVALENGVDTSTPNNKSKKR